MREFDCFPKPLSADNEQEYTAAWARLHQFVYKDTSIIINASELPEITVPVATDVQAVLSMIGIPIEVYVKKPLVLGIRGESKEGLGTSTEGIEKRVLAYRLPETLFLIGSDIDADQNAVVRHNYLLSVPTDDDLSGMYAIDFGKNGGTYKPGENPDDVRQSQLFAQVLQSGVKDILSFVPRPAPEISI